MSKEEKEKIDIQEITTLFRNVMFGMALTIITRYFIANSLENLAIENIAFYAAFLIGIPYLLIASNSKKHKIRSYNTPALPMSPKRMDWQMIRLNLVPNCV